MSEEPFNVTAPPHTEGEAGFEYLTTELTKLFAGYRDTFGAE